MNEESIRNIRERRNPNPAKAQGLGFTMSTPNLLRSASDSLSPLKNPVPITLILRRKNPNNSLLERDERREMWDLRERRNPNPVKSPGTIFTPTLLRGAPLSVSLSTHFVCVDRECFVLWRKPRSRLLLLWLEVNSGTYFGCGGGTLFFCGRKNPDLFCWSGLKQCGSGTQFCRTDVASSAVLAFEFKAVFFWAVSGSWWMKGEA
jgi:hypothetical protein